MSRPSNEETKLATAKEELNAAKNELQAAKQELQAAEQKLQAAEASKNQSLIASARALLTSTTDGVVTAQTGLKTAQNAVTYFSNLLYSSPGKRKSRKSLPPARSGSKWTADDLQRLNIVILPMLHHQVIGVDSEDNLPPLSDRATNLLQQCMPILDAPHAVDKIFLGERVGAVPDQDPRTRSGVEWVLLKYLSLMVGQGRMKLESVVDDFLIHLLVALGYNDGDLVVLSKNQLDMTMNRSNEYATADITVFDVIRRFRLVVMEEKQEEPTGTSKSKLANYEAQLVAEALAAAQANVMQQESKRRRATSEGGDVHSQHFADTTAGVIYLVRVVGPVFSFYSINPSIAFLNIFEDYRELGDDQEPPVTVVSQCSFTFPSNPSDPAVSTLSAADRTWTEFNFLVPAHRHLIVSLLDWIRSRITA